MTSQRRITLKEALYYISQEKGLCHAMPCHVGPRGGGGIPGVALGTKEEGEGRLGHSLNGGRQDRGDQ